MLLTVAELRGHIATSLDDEAVLSLLTATENDIAAAAGPEGAQTERVQGGHAALVLAHRVGTVTSVKTNYDTASPLTLATDDYRIDGYILWRLTTGTNPLGYWDGTVEVIHTPPEALAERIRAQVALVRLELTMSSGVTSERMGDYAVGYGSSAAYKQQREAILESLRPVMVR